MSIYSAQTVVRMVKDNPELIPQFANTMQALERFMGAVARNGYGSEKAEGAFKKFAGESGTLDAAITNHGYVRPPKAERKASKARPRKAVDSSDGRA